ncbi:MAG TPA: alpha/beta fold hydrolase [Solirubrobacteraceae bacterium]|jgi:triacylglycerol esterase/lipase EstA (alpha/beta hydrolase family)|nr:alpha/beta fold hydrolase [Solirubrobacteraceae bacterium]
MRHRLPAIALCAALALLAPAGASAQAAPLPVLYNGLAGYAHVSATAAPPGANDFTCKPSAAHPRPVILVHGTFADMSDSWQALSPLLRNNGYCVFALNYGSYLGSGLLGVDATGDIPTSAEQLSGFVDRILSATHAAKVDLVGHSQGGMMPRWYLRFLGGAAKVHTLVGLAPSNHGTTLEGLFTLASDLGAGAFVGVPCPACEQQEAGSAFMQKLNAGSETVPGVEYTNIESANDEVVTPYTSAFMNGPGMHNILLQSQCPLDQGEHLSMPYDHIADADVLSALDPAHPLSPACTPVLPIVGG